MTRVWQQQQGGFLSLRSDRHRETASPPARGVRVGNRVCDPGTRASSHTRKRRSPGRPTKLSDRRNLTARALDSDPAGAWYPQAQPRRAARHLSGAVPRPLGPRNTVASRTRRCPTDRWVTVAGGEPSAMTAQLARRHQHRCRPGDHGVGTGIARLSRLEAVRLTSNPAGRVADGLFCTAPDRSGHLCPDFARRGHRHRQTPGPRPTGGKMMARLVSAKLARVLPDQPKDIAAVTVFSRRTTPGGHQRCHLWFRWIALNMLWCQKRPVGCSSLTAGAGGVYRRTRRG